MEDATDKKQIEITAAGMRRAHGPKAESECFRLIDKYRLREDTHAEQMWELVRRAVRDGNLPKNSRCI